MKYLFYIEPYAELFFGKDDVLLYNTLTGDRMISFNLKEVYFLKKIKRNNFSLVLKENDYYENMDFINKIIGLNIGAIDKYNIKKPFRISNEPILNFEKTGNDIYSMLSYIKGITIYLKNNLGDSNYKYMQTIYPFASKHFQTININSLKSFLFPFNHNFETLSINIVLPNNIKDITKEIKDITDYFGNQKINIYLNQNITDDISNDKHNYILIVDNYNKDILFDNSYTYNFLVENEKEYKCANEIIKKLQLKNYYYTPIYNSNNLYFFEKNVFIDENDIFNNIKTSVDISKNKIINSNYFGKIIIRSDGQVFSNQNYKTHGNIQDISLYDIVINEMNNKGSWFNRRQFKTPCKNCIYKYLCPPISNYELVIKKNNLCSIK